MKIYLAQLNYHIGNFESNTKKIIEEIKKAKSHNVDLIIFSELSICGYPPQDLLEHKDFIDKCSRSVQKIAGECTGIAAIIGAPTLNAQPRGKPLFNSAYFLNNGIIEKTQNKTLLPTYDIFDEYRYFESNTAFDILEYKGHKIALTICEDIWDQQPVDTPLGRSNMYSIAPMEKLSRQNPDMIINIAASPFAYNRINEKKQIFINNAKKYGIPLLFVNQVGANTELIFEGNSMIVNENGQIIKEMHAFKEDSYIFNTKELQSPVYHKKGHVDYIRNIHNALVMGIQDFFGKMGFKKAILGLSGGIDSAVSTVLAVEALGKAHVRVLLMPSKYSSGHSVTDSEQLAGNLGIQYDILPVNKIVSSFDDVLAPLFSNLPENTAEENIQARIRATLLMALSNKFGNILLNTSNKSEAAVGYSTLYGDMAGGLSVLGDVYKTDLYKLANYINREQEVIPQNIITKPPSAELRPDQKDSDSLPDYDLLDQILYRYIEQQKPAAIIIEEGYDKELVDKVIRLINMNEYKRYQAPPMLRVSSKAFGMGRRMPLVAKY
jgi:NAD+ synthase (glutamine-hydrolysing)